MKAKLVNKTILQSENVASEIEMEAHLERMVSLSATVEGKEKPWQETGNLPAPENPLQFYGSRDPHLLLGNHFQT